MLTSNIFYNESEKLSVSGKWKIYSGTEEKFSGSEEEMNRAMMINTWDAKSLHGIYNERQLELYRNMYQLPIENRKSLTLIQL